MTSVHSLDTTKELERFFDTLYGEHTGYVYSPTKDAETENFEQHFFEWPSEKIRLIKHVMQKSETLEVYSAPALFSEKASKKEAFYGTNYVWVDFDGNAPSSLEAYKDVPEPCIKIQSSKDGHEHWYWQLEGFVTDINVVENINRRLTYHLNGDSGCWDANRVLRPPHTINHKRSRATSTLRWAPQPTHIDKFASLPEIFSKAINDDDIKFVPEAVDMIAKYAFPDEAWKLFRAKIEDGSRHQALTKLCFYCIEMGMSPAESLSIIKQADDRWKKYSNRKDQRKWLIGIINHCRAEKESRAKQEVSTGEVKEEYDPFKVYTYSELMSSELKLEWVVNNFIHTKTVAFLIGPPDVGKTTFTLRLCEKFIEGKQFLPWTPKEPQRIMFITMEQPFEEIKHQLSAMDIKNSELIDNLLIMPVGHTESLDSPQVQTLLYKKIEEFKPNGIVIDSWGAAIGKELNSDKAATDVFKYVNMLRDTFNIYFWFIFHPRKEQIGNKKPKKLDDIHGTGVVGRQARLVVGMWSENNSIEIYNLKNTMNQHFAPFYIKRTPGLNFEIIQSKTVSEGPIFGGLSASKIVSDSDTDLSTLL